MQIDTQNIVLFGHSMGGFVCLKSLELIPGIKKGFAVSAWDIYREVAPGEKNTVLAALEKEADDYFVLNKRSGKELYAAVQNDPGFFDLHNSASGLSQKQLVMLDEHNKNKPLADLFKQTNRAYFNYQVWNTDHSFTNKRASLIKEVLSFLGTAN